jgi:autoinducer 2 (AI-2) kinase
MTKQLLLTIDFGTSGIKCMTFSPQGKVLARQYTPIQYTDAEGLFGIGKEFDANAVWQTICSMIPPVLKEAKSKPSDIVSTAATSQRHGAVFLDKEGAAIYAGPNLDARGVFIQDKVMKGLGDACPPTGCWPPLLYSLSRLLWFKQEKPEKFSQIHHVLSISDWIVYQLTGKATTDPTQASNTQLMDIHTSQWSPEILEMADLSSELLPEISPPGSPVGNISPEASKSTSLSQSSVVGIGGADTQCALLGSAAIEPGNVGIVAGNTGPVQLVTSEPLIDPRNRLWTGRFLLPQKWVLEANSGPNGSVLNWFINNFILPLSPNLNGPTAQAFTRVEQLAAQAPVGSFDTIALLGPQIMDASDMTTVRPSMLLFPPPTSPVVTPISMREVARALFENICYAARTNLEQIQELANHPFNKCIVAGGLTRSQFWRQMLADVTGLTIETGQVIEASSLGAAICAATAAGIYDSLPAAVSEMVVLEPALYPSEDIHNQYKTYFTRWQTMYNQSTNL